MGRQEEKMNSNDDETRHSDAFTDLKGQEHLMGVLSPLGPEV